MNELYIAEKDQGAYLNGRDIEVSKISREKYINTFCHGSEQKDIKKAMAYCRKQKLNELTCRQLGSAAIELAYVASGRVDSYMAPGVHIWDVAAGALLVREAGGRVTDFKGKTWQMNSKGIAASNNIIHSQVLKTIANN